ncbi:MAG TPA: long-chain fatty acid--CoA ligase [Thermoanaerobaculia bacterium]|nr:long-chain fatty acid--CoA ligase [Thermoanaerobaculia bacterium]
MVVKTINDVFRQTLTLRRPSIMKYKKDGQWIDITLNDFDTRVRRLSTALRHLGVKQGDRVAILSENRPEWTISDFAILAAGAISVPIYPTLLPWQIEYIVNDAGCVVVMVSNAEQLAKMASITAHCPSVRHLVVFEPPGELPKLTQSLASVYEFGAERMKGEESRFDELLGTAMPGDLATLVYTSGTTGNPKGAMLTHGNIGSNIAATIDLVDIRPGDLTLSILPLSHILERTADFAFLAAGGTIAYAESVAKVSENLIEIKPDIFAAVPRLFEKMQARIMETVATAPPARQKIFHWALDVAKRRLPYVVEQRPLPPFLALQSFIADRLVFKKIMAKLGGRVRWVLSGGAPLSADLAAFFIGAGLEILEGYGLTETSPVISLNTIKHRRLGTVGQPVPGVEVKIAEDGEILSRGPHIMKGYFNNPEATAQAIDADGWFHTGDIGLLDQDNFLKITDRKKDLIINAYGKNIAPQPLEGLLKTSPYVGTPVLIGDRRKYLSALIVPNFEMLEREAKAAGVVASSPEELVANPHVISLVQKEIDRFNQNLDRQEKIRRFVLLPRDFSIETGEMTPSMKVKRKVVDEKYKALIDSMYAGDVGE